MTVGRWANSGSNTSQPFAVSGAWRLYWSVTNPNQSFNAELVSDDGRAPQPLIGQAGTTRGSFDESRGGVYRLIFHNVGFYEAEAVVPEEPSP